MKQSSTSFQTKSKIALSLWDILAYRSKRSYFSLFMLPVLIFLLAGVSGMNAQGICESNQAWWKNGFKKDKQEGYLALKNGVLNGDTVHLISCQVPRGISASDLKYYKDIKNKECYSDRGIFYPNKPLYGFINPKPCYKIKTYCYKVDIGDGVDTGIYQLWKYEYIVEDVHCAREYKKVYYVAMYDLAGPTYQCFPKDTAVASAADLPPVDEKVKIIDICQYVAWWKVETEAVVDSTSGDTIGYRRTWSAGDPTGNESSRSQMIWISSDSDDDSDGSTPLVNQNSNIDKKWKVYPNPVKEYVRVNIYSDEPLNYNLYDGMGRSVKAGLYQRGQQIGIQSLDPGLYYLQMSNSDLLLNTQKIMIVK